jgi:membrane carboxypeptidase/penicillin-binding protein
VDDFPVPEGTTTRPVCAETGMLATEACPNVTTERFPEGSEPTELCTAHPGKPLKEPDAGSPPPVPDLRDLDRKDTEHEIIHIR